jgi:hypothetical protein
MRSRQPFAFAAWAMGALALAALGIACSGKSAASDESGARAAPAAVSVRPAATTPAEPNCGGQGMPECPLQSWMDAHLNGPLSREEYPTLVRAFRDLAAVGPSEYAGGWAAWAKVGASAAEHKDHAAIHKACAGCHDNYRAHYRKTLRERPMPPADPP